MGLTVTPSIQSTEIRGNLFSGPRVQITQKFQIGLTSGRIPTVGVIRYLGMWLDQNLVWHYHVREATARAKRLLWSLRRTMGRNWGAAPDVMLRLIQ